MNKTENAILSHKKTAKLSAELDGILGKGRLWDLQGQLAPFGEATTSHKQLSAAL